MPMQDRRGKEERRRRYRQRKTLLPTILQGKKGKRLSLECFRASEGKGREIHTKKNEREKKKRNVMTKRKEKICDSTCPTRYCRHLLGELTVGGC